MNKYFNSIEERLMAHYSDCVTDRAQKTARLFVEKRHGDLSGYAAEQGRKFDNLIRDYVVPHIKVVRKVGYKSPVMLEVLRAVNIYKRKGYVELIKSLHPSLFVVKKQVPVKNKVDIAGLNSEKINVLAHSYKTYLEKNRELYPNEILYIGLKGSKSSTKAGNISAINNHFNGKMSFSNEGIDFLIEKGFSLVDYAFGKYNAYQDITAKLNVDVQNNMITQLESAYLSVYAQNSLEKLVSGQQQEVPTVMPSPEVKFTTSTDFIMDVFDTAVPPKLQSNESATAPPPKFFNATGRSSRRGGYFIPYQPDTEKSKSTTPGVRRTWSHYNRSLIDKLKSKKDDE